MYIDQQEHFLLTALQLRSVQQKVISSNIANAQTPNYQARVLDFKTALMQNTFAAATVLPTKELQNTDQRFLEIEKTGYIRPRDHPPSRLDGNTVNMNEERADFMSNTVHIHALLALLKAHYRLYQLAITGQ